MRVALALVSLLCAAGAAVAEETPTRLQDVPAALEKGGMERRDERSEGRFDIELDALEPTAGETSAKVKLTNLGDVALEEVELVCSAFDEREREVSQRSWRLKESGSGAMQPGEKLAITLRFGAPASVVRSATCNARGW
ncbi:MAG: hypothetical protein ACREQJ_17140 [Candidatus Binatia bacterium]